MAAICAGTLFEDNTPRRGAFRLFKAHLRFRLYLEMPQAATPYFGLSYIEQDLRFVPPNNQVLKIDRHIPLDGRSR